MTFCWSFRPGNPPLLDVARFMAGLMRDPAVNRRFQLKSWELKPGGAGEGGTPLLGICVGMQLLFDESEEMGRHAGLGIIPGRVVRFAADLMPEPGHPAGKEPEEQSSRPLKIPQIGWNQLHHAGNDPLLAGVPDGAYAYFVHSYYCAPAEPSHVVATTDYGISYASVVRRGRVWGIQCHPEKSQAVGLRILRNFMAIVDREKDSA